MISRSWLRRRRPEVNCRELGKVLQSYLDDDVEPDFAAKIAKEKRGMMESEEDVA